MLLEHKIQHQHRKYTVFNFYIIFSSQFAHNIHPNVVTHCYVMWL